jgi:hypothetical protein
VLTRAIRIGRKQWQEWQIPMRYSSVLEAPQARGKRGAAFYRGARRGEEVRVRAGLNRAAGRRRAGEGRHPEEEGGPDR